MLHFQTPNVPSFFLLPLSFLSASVLPSPPISLFFSFFHVSFLDVTSLPSIQDSLLHSFTSYLFLPQFLCSHTVSTLSSNLFLFLFFFTSEFPSFYLFSFRPHSIYHPGPNTKFFSIFSECLLGQKLFRVIR
jgi:hypothetical protein